MQRGVLALLVLSVRCLTFGNNPRKRLILALSLSLLISMTIGIFPPIFWSFQHGVSSDFMMGLFFMFADFVFPCVILSLVLASIPVFDRKFSGGQAQGDLRP